jgi:hypothetical protein
MEALTADNADHADGRGRGAFVSVRSQRTQRSNSQSILPSKFFISMNDDRAAVVPRLPATSCRLSSPETTKFLGMNGSRFDR